MQNPLQITNHNLFLSAIEEERIRSKAEKLEQFCDQIISCHVIVDAPCHHKGRGELFQLHINIHVPGTELVVKPDPAETIHLAIRDAFAAARRQLQDYVGRRADGTC